MRKVALAFALAALVAVVAFAGEEEKSPTNSPWFDLENCDFCKHLSAQEGLMDHMDWENINFAAGSMSVTTVAPGYEDKFKKAIQLMEEAGKKMMAGEKLHMCGMCQSMGELFQTGKAQYESFETKGGWVSLTTSTDPETIKKIHAHTDRTNEEFAKMVAAEAHEKHDH